ncbi:hypothetical protein SOVF_157120 isoform A [Spinacia oleracea]|nr:hypothetical protein SOVF_157120 isoform A [Spinacia oleracea]
MAKMCKEAAYRVSTDRCLGVTCQVFITFKDRGNESSWCRLMWH